MRRKIFSVKQELIPIQKVQSVTKFTNSLFRKYFQQFQYYNFYTCIFEKRKYGT